MNITNYIKDIHDFPKEGIVFKDISPLLANPQAFKHVIDSIASRYASKGNYLNYGNQFTESRR